MVLVRNYVSTITECVNFLRNELGTEGLFRVNGSYAQVEKLMMCARKGKPISFPPTSDPHTISSFLKKFLRETNPPLLSDTMYDQWIDAGQIQDKDKRTQRVRELLRRLDPELLVPLSYVISFFHELGSYQQFNRMTIKNLAIVLGPNILRNDATDPMHVINDIPATNTVAFTLISRYHELFMGHASELKQSELPPARHAPTAPQTKIDTVEEQRLSMRYPPPAGGGDADARRARMAAHSDCMRSLMAISQGITKLQAKDAGDVGMDWAAMKGQLTEMAGKIRFLGK